MSAVDSPPSDRLARRSLSGTRAQTGFRRRPGIAWPLALTLLLGAANFLWQLGSSSYFEDEVFSIQAASHSLSGVISAVRLTEYTPPTYYLFLHEWMGRVATQPEWLVRLPSALAGMALVGAVYWTARAFVDRWGALAAAVLCALSPLVLQYAQEVRAYVFAMLAVTVAVGATIRGVRERDARTRMLSLGALAAAITLLLHYTSTLVILPLCVWVAARSAISRRARAALLGGCVLAELLIAPLFLHTYRYVPNGALGHTATVTWTNIAQVAQTPFARREATGVDALTILAAVATVASVIGLAVLPAVSGRVRATAAVRDRGLLIALASFAPLVLLVGALAGKSVLITRYSAVAAPFLIIAAAAAVRSLPRPAAAVLAVAVLVPAAVGVIVSHTRRGFYPDTRDAVAYIRSHHQPGQLLDPPALGEVSIPLGYYAGLRLHPPPPFVGGAQALRTAAHNGHPVWIVGWLPRTGYSTRSLRRFASPILGRLGYRLERLRTFSTSGTVELILALPRAVTPG